MCVQCTLLAFDIFDIAVIAYRSEPTERESIAHFHVACGVVVVAVVVDHRHRRRRCRCLRDNRHRNEAKRITVTLPSQPNTHIAHSARLCKTVDFATKP